MRRQLKTPFFSRGFTLAEVIIVIFILALVSGILLLRLGSTSPVRVTERAAKQLQSFLIVAQEQALLQPAVLGLSLADEGYQVLELRDTSVGQWVPLEERARFWQAHPLDSNIQLTLFVNQKQVAVPSLLRASNQPQITMLPSGELTPFELFIQHRSGSVAYRITGNFAGQLDMTEVR